MLANAGLGSRRQIEKWIEQGRIVVDGAPARLGDRITGDERIALDGHAVRLRPAETAAEHSHLAYYKPVGELTARSDAQGRKIVFEALPSPKAGRWIGVGRLDVASSGLLLFTTDGELAHRLMHPRFEIPREYAVRLLGELSDGQLAELGQGVELDDGPARFDHIARAGGRGANTWYRVTLGEGRNREVRRMFDVLGLAVSRLIRVRYGPIELGRMRRGESRPLSRAEIDALYRAVDLKPPRRPRKR